MKRKLFFKGKIYVSAKCSAIHTFSEDCAKETLQESARENNDTDDTTQDNKQKTVHENTKNNLKRTNKLQITFNKNKTTQSADVIRHLRRKTKNSHTTANINKRGEDETLQASYQHHNRRIFLSPCVLSTMIPKTPATVIQETPASDRQGGC